MLLFEIDELKKPTNVKSDSAYFKDKATVLYEISLSILSSGKYNRLDDVLVNANLMYNKMEDVGIL